VLYDRCRAAALSAGVERIEVYASLNAVGFYARMGFARVEQLSIQLGPGVTFAAQRMGARL
jgi:N-acetylglutamate synthase-like GNAT family acetyltransferase